jgi:formiminoglutamase
MSGESSNAVAWFTLLEPARPPADLVPRADDPRLGKILEFWQGNPAALKPGRPVLIGYPQDEGVRRNRGRPGAAQAPDEIRRWLYRLTPDDSEAGVGLREQPPLDGGNLQLSGSLEDSQEALGKVIAGILQTGAIPVVLGGGHETAFGHYLGYVAAQRRVGIVNIDAHLDLRPCLNGQGHSGSPFRQALEHSEAPLLGEEYVCLGAEPHAVAAEHLQYAQRRGCVVRWRNSVKRGLVAQFLHECDRLATRGCQVYVSVDADVVRQAEIPGVSAPNPAGLCGKQVLACARAAGHSPQVSSLDLVEINPRFDRDGQSARWAALLIWNFLIGVASRRMLSTSPKRPV